MIKTNSPHSKSCLIGINKGNHDSSVCLSTYPYDQNEVILLTERLSRKKNDGSWPTLSLEKLRSIFTDHDLLICESRYGMPCLQHENLLNEKLPFFEALEKKNLSLFSSHFNKNIQEISHHLAHAYSALGHSPFEESLIIVIDGAGSLYDHTTEKAKENFDPYGEPLIISKDKKDQLAESLSVYHQRGSEITPLEKYWQKAHSSENSPLPRVFDGIGMFYEYAAQYIFNCKHSAGKVMGLSSFSEGEAIEDRVAFINSLDWSNAYDGKSKEDWENSPLRDHYTHVASSVQRHYEESFMSLFRGLKDRYPFVKNIMLTGGCALNCVANSLLQESKLFTEVHVSPFPDDKGISYGNVNYLKYKHLNLEWKPIPISKQKSNFGPGYCTQEDELKSLFKNFKVNKLKDPLDKVASLLNEDKIIAVFQGGSESGARALGHRSILAGLNYPNLKDFLNSHVKFREAFRPYGASCLQKYASTYFEVKDDFDSPFMSFTPKVRENFRDTFKEICHINNTSRIQTVKREQNTFLYELLTLYGQKSGLYCLLNTSFNIMGEPIIETIEDCKTFYERNSAIDGILIEDYLIEK